MDDNNPNPSINNISPSDTSSPPPPTELPTNLSILGESPPPPQKKAGGKTGTALLVLSSFVMAISLSYSLYAVLKPAGSQDLRSKAAESTYEASKTVKVTDNFKVRPEVRDKWQRILDNVPVNPQTVIATASGNGKTVTLESGKAYTYSEVTFTWSGERAVEPGTNIIGYYLYFGPKSIETPFPLDGSDKSTNPQYEGTLIATNSYTERGLTKGSTYYLYIQTKTDSKTAYYNIGLEKVGYLQTLPAKKLFTYTYQ